MNYKRQINRKGVTLIVVIFAMMILGILGWTLAAMLATDFQANLRSFDSEKALYLADAGKEWALRKLLSNSSWNTSSDSYCNQSSDWLLHNLNGGQYEVCCRGNQTGEDAFTVVEIAGYVPQKTNYLAMRKVKFLVNAGRFRYVAQTKDLFDWSAVNKTAGDSYFNGHIQAGHYDGNGDGIYDELGVDYRGPPNELPVDNSAIPRDRLLASQPYPDIDMNYYRAQAQSQGNLWPENWVASEAQITGRHTQGSRTHIVVNAPIFSVPDSQWRNNIVRNIEPGRAWNGVDWRVIRDRENNNEVEVNDFSDWQIGDTIRIGRRFYQNEGNGDIFYVQKADVLIDVQNDDITMITIRRSGIVVEGDIVIKGSNGLTFSDRVWRTDIWPALGTENGNITSLDAPYGSTNSERRSRRNFDNTIYSKNGTIDWNYLEGEAVIGNKIIFHNSIRLNYDPYESSFSGFGWGVAKRDWVEE
ncbi:MAG: hypothetical protein V1853_03000 [bacterium]